MIKTTPSSGKRSHAAFSSQTHAPAASTTSTSDASNSTSSASALESRLQATNTRIAHLLDQMSWQETGTQDAAASSTTSNPFPASTPASAAAVSTSAPSLLSTCRPFDRASYLAFVSTYTPLTWSHKDSPLLSPLECARRGWICSNSIAHRDILCCPLCRTQLAMQFSPQVLAHAPAVESLSLRYSSMLREHSKDCAWFGCEFDERFSRLLPKDMSRETAIWVALHQVRARQDSLARLPQMYLSEEFMRRFREEADKNAGSSASPPSFTLQSTLALCGWEDRSMNNRNPTSTLQCWFGCREIHVHQYLAPPTASDDTKIQIPTEQEHVESKEDIEAAGEHANEGEEEEEERSEFQSPLKRRKLTSTSTPTSAQPSPASADSSVCAHPILTSPAGFDPLRSHRPFCPFLQPLPQESKEVEPKDSPHSNAASSIDDPLQAWQELLGWWIQRHHEPGVTIPVGEDSSTPIDVDEATPSAALASATTTSSSVHSGPQKEREYKKIVATVRQLLSNTVNTAAVLK